MDPLSELLKTIRLTGAALVEAQLQAPWSFLIPFARTLSDAVLLQAEHVGSCHIILEGVCTVGLADSATVELAAGEVVIFPHGDQHVLCSSRRQPPDTLTSLDMARLVSKETPKPVRCGGGGEATGVVTVFFACDPQFLAPMLTALPRMMRVNLNNDPRTAWLHSAVRCSAQESAHARAGAATMLTKLSELLFAEVARRYFEHAPWSKAGWLRGLRDPRTAKALALMHRVPEQKWTVDGLAEEVGVSRSTLAKHFARYVSEPPMQYLKRLRLRLAADRLLDGKTGIGRIAEQAGYDSEAAFTRAFKREFGLPPATWRRRNVAAVPRKTP